MIRDLDDKRLGQNSDFSLLPLSCCLFFVDSISALLVRPVGCPCFCLAGSLTVGLAIGGTVLIAGKVAVGLLGWSL